MYYSEFPGKKIYSEKNRIEIEDNDIKHRFNFADKCKFDSIYCCM